MSIEIREARKEDCREIDKLIRELANFEKMPDGPKNNYRDLEKDGFETEPPLFKAFVAFDDDKIIGHAIFYNTYSTWQGKSMFLDELYITPDYRNRGIGGRIFDRVAKKADEDKCRRLEFSVLNWNRAKSFYAKKGAIDLTETEDWHNFRLDGDDLKKFRNYP